MLSEPTNHYLLWTQIWRHHAEKRKVWRVYVKETAWRIEFFIRTTLLNEPFGRLQFHLFRARLQAATLSAGYRASHGEARVPEGKAQAESRVGRLLVRTSAIDSRRQSLEESRNVGAAMVLAGWWSPAFLAKVGKAVGANRYNLVPKVSAWRHRPWQRQVYLMVLNMRLAVFQLMLT